VPAWSPSLLRLRNRKVAIAYVVAGLGGGVLSEAAGVQPTFVVAAALTAAVGLVSLAVPVREVALRQR
jgi:hypothetical protein